MRKAKDALDNVNGLELEGRELRLDFAKSPSGGGGGGGGRGGYRGGGGAGGGRGQLLIHNWVLLVLDHMCVCLWCSIWLLSTQT